MLKDILKKLGVEVEEDKSDEELEELINQQIDAKDEHIATLEEEKSTLSKSTEELTASVEGLKADKEKVDKELSETKGRLNQVTEMYKEQFTKPLDEPDKKSNTDKVTTDVMQLLIDAN